jgi:hypothetical protein
MHSYSKSLPAERHCFQQKPLKQPSANASFPRLAISMQAVLPILLGGGLYTLWRSPHLLIFRFYHLMGLHPLIFNLRLHTAWIKPHIPQAILFSLPDGCWVYSYTVVMLLVWRKDKKTFVAQFWTLLPLTMAVVSEIGQHFRLVPGSFDWVDIFAYFVAYIAAYLSMSWILSFEGKTTERT